MNETKKILDLTNKIEKKEIPIDNKNYSNIKTKFITIDKVKFILQEHVDTSGILTGLDILNLDKTDKDALVDIKPKLYKEFICKKTNEIKTFVNVEDIVEIKGEIGQYKVLNIRFKYLNDMTVIVADLKDINSNEVSFSITNKLLILKE